MNKFFFFELRKPEVKTDFFSEQMKDFKGYPRGKEQEHWGS